MINEIINELLKQKDEKYQKFSSSLLPGVNNVLGVRLPILKKIAKEMMKKDYRSFLLADSSKYLELTLIQAFMIGNLKGELGEIYFYIENFISKITNWSICDSFCASLKIVKENKKEFLARIEKYSKSKSEFELRFFYVILLNYYIESDFYYVLDKIKIFNSEFYYAKMAVAWLLSICFVKNFDETYDFLNKQKVQDFVFKKGITKAIESYRLTKNQKDKLRALRSGGANFNPS